MWSSTIQRILSSSISSTFASPSISDNSTFLARSTRYLPGMFWRQFVAKCVLFDLLEPQVQGEEGAAGERRRIVRMDEMGLGGIVMYAVPQNWTLERVFGVERQHGGMGEQEFLDGIQVELAYTPLYACTSFVTGQVMTAYLHGTDPPIPASAGLGFSASFSSFEHGIRLSKPVSLSTARQNLKRLPLSECASRFRVEHNRLSLTHCVDDEEDAEDRIKHLLLESDGIDSRTPIVSDFPCITTSLPASPVPMALSVYTLSTPLSDLEELSLSASSSSLNVESSTRPSLLLRQPNG
ncbi:hypothetical protein VNI00_004425 [Paramarasmius palmivorus]|uniref:Uncharacterized protein n=1 Tax=Paramarasmius palmivorus TaxID=297713 RepID=A0AAW0DF71_9AGAR